MASMKSDYIIYGVLGIVVIIFAYTMVGLFNEDNQEQPTPLQNSASNSKTITSGNTDAGNAQIDLTPIGFENNQLKVDFAINTHSVDLSQYDLIKITTLEYSGNKINPISAPKLQGHHTSGTIVFNTGKEIKMSELLERNHLYLGSGKASNSEHAQKPMVFDNFKITIVGMPNIEERVFEWK